MHAFIALFDRRLSMEGSVYHYSYDNFQTSVLNGAGDIPAQGPWAVELFATNLLDEQYIKDAGNTGGAFGIPTFIAGKPRYSGVSFSIRY